MPGNVSASNARGAPTISPDADFGICVIGYSTANPVSAGLVTNAYSNAATAAGDLGLGDAVDCLTHAIVPSQVDNPAPQGVSFYSTPATTPGVRGSLTVTGVTGTSVVTATAGQHPVGTFTPTTKVLVGGTVGTPGIIVQTTLGVGGPPLPPVQLGSAVTYAPAISINGTPVALGIGYSLAAGTLIAGDVWSEAKTTPPMWGDTDLYSAGPPAAGAFAAIARSAAPCGLIVITEPVASGDFSTLVAGQNYLLTFNKRPAILVRFRDPTSGETDAQYVTAFQTFALACRNAGITCVVGNGWLTDAFRAFVYFRSGLPEVVRRLQSNVARPGKYGEKLAKSPAFVGDGPLVNFTLKDLNGNPIAQAHDELAAGGIDGPLADGGGGGITFYYNPSQGIAGTYISEAPCLYPSGSTVLTLMDTRVTNGIMRELSAVAWTEIQGTEIVNGGILDQDAADAMSQRMRAAVLAKFSSEFANPEDPNLIVVNPAVTVSGPNVSLTVAVNDQLFDYANSIAITLYNIR